jgi:hypothetical protein
MRRIFALVIAGALLATMTVGTASAAPMKRYPNCAALLKAYPAGVAKDRRSAVAAVKDGQRRPAVRPKVYRDNARLDRDKDGTACEQPAKKATAPESEAAPTVFYVPSGIPLMDAVYGARAKNGEMTQDQSTFVTAWASTLARQNWRTICTGWSIDVFKDEFFMAALTPEVLLSANLLGQEAWAKENASLVTTMFCVNRGYSYA